MYEEVTTEELLQAWRDAVRAAELAERLATIAAETSRSADQRAVASSELATLAEQAAEAATRAAQRARATATEAAELARQMETTGVPDAERSLRDSKQVETEAADAYREAESQARARHHSA